jgi:phospholipase C
MRRRSSARSFPVLAATLARAWLLALLVSVVAVLGATRSSARSAPGSPGSSPRLAGSPIHHVVVVDMENHSFDNVLGKLCVLDGRCDGTLTGKLADGTVISLPRAADLVPQVPHSHGTQVKAIDGGRMDGFSKLSNCGQPKGYQCYQQFGPSQIPNLAALARAFTISDRTFEGAKASSWGSHLELVAATLDGFTGDNPVRQDGAPIPGGGCDAPDVDAAWSPDGSAPIMVPSCVPFPDGSGAYRSTPVAWVPTIMDRLQEAGRSWRLYVGSWPDLPTGYGWPVCPTFADCILTDQRQHVFGAEQIVSDAAAGALPAFSLVTPTVPESQHNTRSMLHGDNWLGRIVSAIESGPDWGSAAVFVTYDDCGCFYDHVPPPAGRGIRVPMVIVSPYARPGSTDSTVASFDSILAFTEHTFGLRPLGPGDRGAYDYSGAFDYGQRPVEPVRLRSRALPAWERRWLAAHPADPTDPT